MKEFRHILFMETGGHDWKPIVSDYKYTDHKGQEYVMHKCTQCGMTAQFYININHTTYEEGRSSLYVGPQYPREYVRKCPNELGLFKDAAEGALVAVLGGGECEPIKTKKKKKKGKKKGKNKKKKKLEALLNLSPVFASTKRIRLEGKPTRTVEVKTKKRKRTRS